MPAALATISMVLEQRRDRLRLAVAEAMVVIRRQRRDAHREQRDEARHQVERRIGEAAQHRDRAGGGGGVALEHQQRGSERDRRERGARGQPAVIGERVARAVRGGGGAHGYSSPVVQPSPRSSRVNTWRSCMRNWRSCQNSMRLGVMRKPDQKGGRGTGWPANRASTSATRAS